MSSGWPTMIGGPSPIDREIGNADR